MSDVPRKAWIDFVKGIAILMVVYFHAWLYLGHYGVEGLLGRSKAIFELFPMPAFFLLSGLFAPRIATFTFAQVWKRRLAPIIWMYVIWSIVRALYYLLIPGLNGELGELSATNPISLALIFFWPSSSYWFLYALFLFTLAFWLLRKVPTWAAVPFAGIISALFTSGILDAHNIGWNRIGALFVFFIGGARFSPQIIAWVERTRLRFVIPLALAVGVVALAVLFLGLRGVPFLVLIGQTAAVAIGCVLARYLVRLRPLQFITYVGKQSLPIYLLHLYVIVLVCALIGLLDPHWPRYIDVPLHLALVAFTVWGSLQLAKLTSKARWLYVPPQRKKKSVVPSAAPTE